MTSLPDPDRQPQFYHGIPSKRLLAWVIDMVLIIALCAIILPFTAFTGIFFFPFLVMVVGFAYRVITLTGGSATFGMRFAAIELRTQNGERFDLSTAFLHTLGYTVSISLPVLQVISIVLMMTNARAQGLTDHVLGTVALARRAVV